MPARMYPKTIGCFSFLVKTTMAAATIMMIMKSKTRKLAGSLPKSKKFGKTLEVWFT